MAMRQVCCSSKAVSDHLTFLVDSTCGLSSQINQPFLNNSVRGQGFRHRIALPIPVMLGLEIFVRVRPVTIDAMRLGAYGVIVAMCPWVFDELGVGRADRAGAACLGSVARNGDHAAQKNWTCTFGDVPVNRGLRVGRSPSILIRQAPFAKSSGWALSFDARCCAENAVLSRQSDQ
jgi:hypothetical protein